MAFVLTKLGQLSALLLGSPAFSKPVLASPAEALSSGFFLLFFLFVFLDRVPGIKGVWRPPPPSLTFLIL